MPHRANRTFVTNSDALTAWTPIAREVLIETAATYQAVVPVARLVDEVQTATGISADQPADVWIGKLLERVAREAERRGEPPLASLCPVADDDERAAADRLACYREYAVDLPEDGGHPAPIVRSALPRRRTSASSRPSTRKPADAPRLREVTCTSCFMIVAERETCSSCGAPLAV